MPDKLKIAVSRCPARRATGRENAVGLPRLGQICANETPRTAGQHPVSTRSAQHARPAGPRRADLDVPAEARGDDTSVTGVSAHTCCTPAVAQGAGRVQGGRQHCGARASKHRVPLPDRTRIRTASRPGTRVRCRTVAWPDRHSRTGVGTPKQCQRGGERDRDRDRNKDRGGNVRAYVCKKKPERMREGETDRNQRQRSHAHASVRVCSTHGHGVGGHGPDNGDGWLRTDGVLLLKPAGNMVQSKAKNGSTHARTHHVGSLEASARGKAHAAVRSLVARHSSHHVLEHYLHYRQASLGQVAGVGSWPGTWQGGMLQGC